MNKIKTHDTKPIKEIIDIHNKFNKWLFENCLEKSQDSEAEKKKEGTTEALTGSKDN